MKRLRTILGITVLILSFISCKDDGNNENELNIKTDESTGSFDWLLGNWQRSNEVKDKETFEIWEKLDNSNYFGIGFTIQNNDTIKQEKMKLTKSNDKWTLKVRTQGETEPTLFAMTSYTENEFICKNSELDFPKLIKYWKNDEKINALVSGDEIKISFEFEKISKN